MKWMRFKVRTTAEAEDILISAMQDIGLCGAQIEDHVPLTAAEKEQMFVDILPDMEEDDSAVVSFYVEELPCGRAGNAGTEPAPVTADGGGAGNEACEAGAARLLLGGEECSPEEVLERMDRVVCGLRACCGSIGEGTITIEETEDQDWVNNWKQYFHQFRIDDILVIPSWETPAEGDNDRGKPSTVFHIDPGTAFGTGAHETTQLCIRAMRPFLTPRTRLLDVGTGSGILSILALMLGAQSAVGTDLDPCTEPAVQSNLRANDVDPERFRLILGNIITEPRIQDEVGKACYDMVVANILPDVLIPLTPVAAKALRPGGVYVTGGILEGKETSVMEAMRAEGLSVTGVTAQGEWRCVTGRKPQQSVTGPENSSV